MKRLLLLVLFLPLWMHAQVTYTPNLHLAQPPQGYPNWAGIINQNWSIIDTAVGSLQAPYQGAWSNTVTYAMGQVVSVGSIYYVSSIPFNLGNNPTTSPGDWTLYFSTATGGATFPGSPGIVYNTSASASRNATSSDVVGLFSGSGTDYLGVNGTKGTLAYLPQWTGAVTRTFASKDQDIMSVTDFGAVATTNCSTDDTAAIQAAISAVNALPGGGSLVFPQGCYVYSGGYQLIGTNNGRGQGRINIVLQSAEIRVTSTGNTDVFGVGNNAGIYCDGTGWSNGNAGGGCVIDLAATAVVRTLIRNSQQCPPWNLSACPGGSQQEVMYLKGLTISAANLAQVTGPAMVDIEFVYGPTEIEDDSIVNANAVNLRLYGAGNVVFKNNLINGCGEEVGFTCTNSSAAVFEDVADVTSYGVLYQGATAGNYDLTILHSTSVEVYGSYFEVPTGTAGSAHVIDSNGITIDAPNCGGFTSNCVVVDGHALNVVSMGAVTNSGTPGSTTYQYVVAPTVAGTTGIASGYYDAFGQTTTGNATLSGSNFNVVNWNATTNATGYNVYRILGGGSTGLIGTTTGTSFNDTGLAGDSSVPPAVNNSPLMIQIPSPLVATVGTAGTTSYAYSVVGTNSGAYVGQSQIGQTDTGNATLNGTNYNTVTWTAMPGASSYTLYRTLGGGSTGVITTTTSLTFNDQGASGDSTTVPPTYQNAITANVLVNNALSNEFNVVLNNVTGQAYPTNGGVGGAVANAQFFARDIGSHLLSDLTHHTSMLGTVRGPMEVIAATPTTHPEFTCYDFSYQGAIQHTGPDSQMPFPISNVCQGLYTNGSQIHFGLSNNFAAGVTTDVFDLAIAGATFNEPVTAPSFSGTFTGNAATATALANAPSTCTNQVLTGINTTGNPNSCVTVTSAYADSSIAKTGSTNTFSAQQNVNALFAIGAQGQATSGGNFSAYNHYQVASFWNGSAATNENCITSLQPAATGTNPTITWAMNCSGSSGNTVAEFLGFNQFYVVNPSGVNFNFDSASLTSNAHFLMPNIAGTQTMATEAASYTAGHLAAYTSVVGSLGDGGAPVGVRAGSVTITTSTSQAVTFGTAMTTTPSSCQLTPQADPTTVGAYWASSVSSTGFTANIHSSGTITFYYNCTINNTN